MPFVDPWFREGKSISPLDDARRAYETTGNPLHAWRGLQICVECMRAGTFGNDTLPSWLLYYWDRAIAGVVDAVATADEHIALGPDEPIPPKGSRIPPPTDADTLAAIADALGFKRRGQGSRVTAWAAWALDLRDQSLAIAVRRARAEQPRATRKAIVVAVAAREHVSAETVRRAWRTWNALLTPDAPIDDAPPPRPPARRRARRARRRPSR